MSFFDKIFNRKKQIIQQTIMKDSSSFDNNNNKNVSTNKEISEENNEQKVTNMADSIIKNASAKKLPNSTNELNKGELILLKELQYTRIEKQDEIKMQSYFKYEYDMDPDDAPAYLQLFVNFNLLEPIDLQTTIQKHTIPQIKEVLQTKSITTKGKKSDQIQALYDNFTIDELNAAFPPQYYVLSAIGKKLIDDRLDPDDWNYRYTNVDFDEAKKVIDALIASKVYENTILYTNNPFQELPDYVSNNHEAFICTVINSKNSLETAKRILRRLFGIDDTLFYVEKYNAVLRSEKELCESKEMAKLLKDGYGEFYRVCSMEDESVCGCCNAFNGKLLPVNKAVIGVNYPPFTNCSSEYCRCFVCFETVKKEK